MGPWHLAGKPAVIVRTWVLTCSAPPGPRPVGCTEFRASAQGEEGQRAAAPAQQRAFQAEAEGGRGEAEATEGPQEEALPNSGSERKEKSEVQPKRA